MQTCEWLSDKLNENINFTLCCSVMLFYVNGEVTDRIFDTDLKAIHIGWIHPNSKAVKRRWCGVVSGKAHVLGPFFFDEHVTGETYMNILRDKLMLQIERLGEGLPDWFQQDGAPAHYATAVRD